MSDQADAVVATFSRHHEAEAAVRRLVDSGVDMTHFSIIGKGYYSEDKIVGFYNAGDRIKFWGANGAMWGALWGLLFGGMMLTIPVIGHVMVVGQLSSIVLGAVEGAVLGGGLSALGAALFSIGVSKDSVIEYEQVVKADGYLIVGHGHGDEMERAKTILQTAGASRADIHQGLNDESGERRHHATV